MDMLRGVAILLVLGSHYVIPPEKLGVVQPFATIWSTIGWAGVDLFFVLSGFLVSGLIFAEYGECGAVDVRRFVIRRGFKIWPPYAAYIAVLAAWLGWQKLAGPGGDVWAQLWPNVLHIQNYTHTPRVHTWSLAVEEHYYLAVAILFYFLLGHRNAVATLQLLPALIVSSIVGLAVIRHVAFLRAGSAGLNLYATHLRFDGLLFGTLLAYWTHFNPAKLAPLKRHPILLMMAGVVLAAPTLAWAPESSRWTAGIGLTMMYIGFGFFMIGWLNVTIVHPHLRCCMEGRIARSMAPLGFYSYSIYLWHIDLARTPVQKLVKAVAHHALPPALVWVLANIVYLALALFTGVLLARCLEVPSLALRDRLFPSTIKSGLQGMKNAQK